MSSPSLRELAVAAAATAADHAKQLEDEKRAERVEQARGALEQTIGIEPVFVYAEEIAFPIERHRQYGGAYLEENTAEVIAFDVDGIRLVLLSHKAAGSTISRWTLEKSCSRCGGRAFVSKRQSGAAPSGYGISISSNSRELMMRDIGETLQGDGLCVPCLLGLPKNCPACQHQLRT